MERPEHLWVLLEEHLEADMIGLGVIDGYYVL